MSLRLPGASLFGHFRMEDYGHARLRVTAKRCGAFHSHGPHFDPEKPIDARDCLPPSLHPRARLIVPRPLADISLIRMSLSYTYEQRVLQHQAALELLLGLTLKSGSTRNPRQAPTARSQAPKEHHRSRLCERRSLATTTGHPTISAACPPSL